MTEKSVFLLTENDITSETLNKIKQVEQPTVIPLTFKTIKLLEENKIEYSLVDDLISPKDYELIDMTAYNIGRKWWNHVELQPIFDYKGINIALMIESELIPSLLKLIHRIFLIKKIILEFKPDTIYFSNSKKSISKVPELFQKKYNFSIQYLDSDSDEKNFRFENYTVGLDILGRNIEIKLSRKNFFRIKKYYQLFWDMLYKVSTATKKQKKGQKILLLDFNLVTNRSILEELSNSELQTLLANTRRPIVWNETSLKIAKNLNFQKISLENKVSDSHPQIDGIMTALKEFMEKNIFFTEVFSFNNISFWAHFKNDFLDFCASRLSEILFFIDSFNQLLDTEKIELLLTQDDFTQNERAAILICQQRKIPTIFLYSTIVNVIKDGKRAWEVYMIHKIIADKLAISGEMTKQVCLNHKVDSQKLVVIGNPRYDELFSRKDLPHDDTVLVTLSSLPNTAWSTFFSLSFITHYEKLIKEVFVSLAKYDKNVIIKLHPTQDAIIDVQRLASELLPKARIYKNANTYDLITKSDIVISTPSTVITESLILGKPVLLIKYVENDFGIPYEEFNALLTAQSYDEIDSKIKQVLFDEKTRYDLLMGRQNFLNYALTHQGVSSQRLLALIKDTIKD